MNNENTSPIMDDDEVTYKKQALKAAKELYYGQTVIRKIKKAETDREITRIMVTARQAQE